MKTPPPKGFPPKLLEPESEQWLSRPTSIEEARERMRQAPPIELDLDLPSPTASYLLQQRQDMKTGLIVFLSCMVGIFVGVVMFAGIQDAKQIPEEISIRQLVIRCIEAGGNPKDCADMALVVVEQKK